MNNETIASIATAPGRGGIGIVRISGSNTLKIGKAITGVTPKPRHAHFCSFHDRDGNAIDSGLILYFPGPNSFTGEDVIELHAHGGPVILDLLVKEVCALGARQAEPGEFSKRAFLNDKIDLTQAEAIVDLINSTTESAALNASRSLQGEFSKKIESLVEKVTQLRIYVEAAIDFPEEEIDFIQDPQVSDRLLEIIAQFQAISREARQGTLIQEGMKLVIAGKPNAGKSSLLNKLCGQDTAIVTPIEGTTRDVLREHIQIDGLPLHIVDTAGLRDSADEIEQEGIRRAWKEMESADHILLVMDSTQQSNDTIHDRDLWPERKQHLSRNIPLTVIQNKCDLSDTVPGLSELQGNTVINLSAKTGTGMDILKQHLKTSMGFQDSSENSFSARRRHLQSLVNAERFLSNGLQQLQDAGAGELLAEDLRQCQNCLGEITGKISSDELLGEIFSSFCIGK